LRGARARQAEREPPTHGEVVHRGAERRGATELAL
jgi:hypothetical protein